MKDMILTETHLHTAEVSQCAVMPAKKIPAVYKNAGYGNIIVTDHWNKWTLDQFSGTNKEKNKAWLKGYEIVREEGEKLGIHIFLGMEMCVRSRPEDYLVYGLTEEFLFDHMNLYEYPLKEVFRVIDEAGMLIFQAHPFRHYLNVQNPLFMHGVEVFNGNPRHNSENEKALAFAEKHNLLQTSGSDYHMEGDEALGGIYLPKHISSVMQIVDCFKIGAPLYKIDSL